MKKQKNLRSARWKWNVPNFPRKEWWMRSKKNAARRNVSFLDESRRMFVGTFGYSGLKILVDLDIWDILVVLSFAILHPV